MKSIKQKNTYPAFSIIEVLVSLFLFSTALVGVVGLMAGEIWKSIDKRNEAIAGQLSQEGIELVRNIRDNNWVASPPEVGFKDIDSGDNYRIDYKNQSLANGGTAAYLKIDSVSGLYSYGADLETVFRRKIIVSEPSSTQRKITSAVSWGEGVLPASESGLSDCDSSSKCFYTQVTLSDDWGAVK